jgi:succinoglycan biosynthesis transport protein ExoP
MAPADAVRKVRRQIKMQPPERYPPEDRRSPRAGGDWLQPGTEPMPLERYVRIIRERAWVIALCLLVCVAVTVLYVSTATKVYEAEADLLVSPAPRDTETFIGLPLVRESSDPTRDVETVSRLVTTTAVARRARANLGTERTVGGLLNNISAEPVAQSNIVAITATGDSAEEAQTLANAFGRAVVEDRTEQLHDQLDQVLTRLRERRATAGAPDSAAREALELQINELETLRGGPDPTVQLQNTAERPSSPVAPRPVLSVAASIIVGLVLGLVGAFAFELLDPRLRREEQLRRLLRLPVLARVPRESGRGHTPLRPDRLSPATIEAYRTLRATLSASRGGASGPRSVLVTGASASEGKTTTAINLAASLALAGHRVILIEADLRRPSIGRTLGVAPEHDLMDVILDEVELEQALAPVEGYGPNFEVLLARDPGETGAPWADGLFLIRRGRSVQSKVVQLGELLAQHGIEPVGIAVVGVPASETASDYYVSKPRRTRRGPRALARS